MLRTHVFIALVVGLMSCSSGSKETDLPILGEVIQDEYGNQRHYEIPDFELVNHRGDSVDKSFYEGKVRVVDFFFTSCPTICPEMSKNMNRIQESFEDENQLQLLSVSIDTRNDTPDELLRYARKHNFNTTHWDFLTGERGRVFDMAHSHKIMAFEQEVLGKKDLLHDGAFVLVDKDNHVRGYYDGLDTEQVDRLINDIKTLF